jgi:hypothetical protein
VIDAREIAAHRLQSGPLPLPHALRHATEIADALDKAHRRGRPFLTAARNCASRTSAGTSRCGRDGRRLFYRRGQDVVAVTLTSGPALSIVSSSVIASGSYEGAAGNGAPNYEVSAEGRRFVMVRSNDLSSVPDTRLHVVVNWFAELVPRLRPN